MIALKFSLKIPNLTSGSPYRKLEKVTGFGDSRWKHVGYFLVKLITYLCTFSLAPVVRLENLDHTASQETQAFLVSQVRRVHRGLEDCVDNLACLECQDYR